MRGRLLQQAATKDVGFIHTIVANLQSSSDLQIIQLYSSTPTNADLATPSSSFDIDITQYLTNEDLLTSTTFNGPRINLYAQTLRLERLSYFTAIFANASVLGFDFATYLNENATSPLISPSTSPSSTSSIPRDLRPLSIQLQKPHHPYLDVLPFPTLRERAILAATTSPPLLDEDDFCIDLMINEGLVCWGGSSGGGGGTRGAMGRGMETGLPWDSRSWEPRLWFLKKWNWLVGEEEWESRRWWCMVRGERFSS